MTEIERFIEVGIEIDRNIGVNDRIRNIEVKNRHR